MHCITRKCAQNERGCRRAVKLHSFIHSNRLAPDTTLDAALLAVLLILLIQLILLYRNKNLIQFHCVYT